MTERTIYQNELITCIREDRDLWEANADIMIENITETQLVKIRKDDTINELVQLLCMAILRQYECIEGKVDMVDLRMEASPIVNMAVTKLKQNYINLLEGYQAKLEDNRHLAINENARVEIAAKLQEYGRRIRRIKRSMF